MKSTMTKNNKKRVNRAFNCYIEPARHVADLARLDFMSECIAKRNRRWRK